MAPTRSAPSTPSSPLQASAAAAPSPRKRRPATSTAAASTGAMTASPLASSPAAGRHADRSDVLVSAVISTYLLTHLHHVLQRAEYGAKQEGHPALAANYAQLRKVLCLDARTMEDACAHGTLDEAEAARAA